MPSKKNKKRTPQIPDYTKLSFDDLMELYDETFNDGLSEIPTVDLRSAIKTELQNRITPKPSSLKEIENLLQDLAFYHHRYGSAATRHRNLIEQEILSKFSSLLSKQEAK